MEPICQTEWLFCDRMKRRELTYYHAISGRLLMERTRIERLSAYWGQVFQYAPQNKNEICMNLPSAQTTATKIMSSVALHNTCGLKIDPTHLLWIRETAVRRLN